MKTFCFFSILLSIVLVGHALGSEGRDGGVFRLGVSPSGFEGINENDVTAALKAWADTVSSEMGLGKIDVWLLSSSPAELRADLEEHRLDGIAVSVPEYMDIGLKVQEVYIPNTEQAPGTFYVLIVEKDAGISKAEDLRTCKVVIGKERRISLAQPWLETLMVDRDGGPDRSLFREPTTVESPSKAILQVFFHQADAALVTKEAFDIACELNPQLKNRLRVMAESPLFVTTFFFFPNNPDKNQKTEKIKNAILNLDTTPGGRQVLTIIKDSKIREFPASVLGNTVEFVEYYRRVVNGTSPSEAQP